jgi:hypothetical protein
MKDVEVQFAGEYVQVRTTKPEIDHQAKLMRMLLRVKQLTFSSNHIRHIEQIRHIGHSKGSKLTYLSTASRRGQHLPSFGVLLSRGVKTLAHLKAGNQSVTS